MVFKKVELGYGFSDLEPHIDAKTMETHYEKHHTGYTKKLNDAVKDIDAGSIEELLKGVGKLPGEIQTTVKNNGGGYFNHNIFWESMTDNFKELGDGDLREALVSTYGSLDAFKDRFKEAALGVFGSGWAWLILNNGKIEVVKTSNQDNPIMDSDVTILLGLDVWEHAYYLNYQNRRGDYIDAWWNVVNWKKVEERYDNGI